MKIALIFLSLINVSYAILDIKLVREKSVSILKDASKNLSSLEQDNLSYKKRMILSNKFSIYARELESIEIRKGEKYKENPAYAYVEFNRAPIFYTKSLLRLDLNAAASILIHEFAHTYGYYECSADEIMYYALKYSSLGNGLLPLAYFRVCRAKKFFEKKVDIKSRVCGDIVVKKFGKKYLSLGRINHWMGGDICHAPIKSDKEYKFPWDNLEKMNEGDFLEMFSQYLVKL